MSEQSAWFSYVEAAGRASEVTHWDESCDVLVVGAGCAGASAALAAREQGAARVMLADRFVGGGASGLSGGIMYFGGGTRYQQQAGVDDTPENMYNYLKLETQGIVSDDTLRDFCETSVATQQWLEGHGVQFSSNVCPIKTFYPTNEYFLYYSGNELVHEYQQQASSAMRGHRVLWDGFSGEGLMTALLASCRQQGVNMATMSRVVQLYTDDSGRAVGAKMLQIPSASPAATQFARYYKLFSKVRMMLPALEKWALAKLAALEKQYAITRLVKVENGVIIAAGGFVQNKAMMQHYAPKYATGTPLGSPGCDGAGIHLGMSLGATPANMARASSWRFINPPVTWVSGIIVGKNGERLVNETSYGARIGEAMAERTPDGRAYLLFTESQRSQVLKEIISGKMWVMMQKVPALLTLFTNTIKANSWHELAAKTGINAEQLPHTIARYNQLCRNGEDVDFHKPAAALSPLDCGPFYAMDVSIGCRKFVCPTISLGGLPVDERSGLIQNGDGSVIPNVYAVGRSAIGVASHSYVSGLSLADCVYSGRRAGRHAATNLPVD